MSKSELFKDTSQTSRPRLMSQRFSTQTPWYDQPSLTTWVWRHQMVQKRRAKLWRCYFGSHIEDFDQISKLLRRDNKEVQYLHLMHLSCYLGCEISEKGLDKMSNCLKGLAALKGFWFTMGTSNDHKMTIEGLQRFSVGLKKLSSLESLYLCFNSCHVSDDSLSILTKGFRRHISLKSVSLSFSECKEITDLGIFHLCRGLKNLVFLQSLTLQFEKCESITNEVFIPLKKSLKKIKNLQKINFNFDSCIKTSADGMELMTEIFNTLTSFQSVTMRILSYSYSINIGQSEHDQSLKEITFSQTIGRKFWLHIFGIKLNSLPELLKKLFMTLQKFSFTFEFWYGPEDFESKYLDQSLKISPSVQSIDLTFLSFCRITDQGLKEIAQSIKELTCLINLRIDFYNWKNITDRGLQCLSKGIEALGSLQKIALGFTDCINVTDDGFSCLGESLGHLVSLKSLDLYFSNLSYVSDYGLQSFGEGMKKLLTLQEMTFCVDKSSKISDTGRNLFIEALKSHNSLVKAGVDFGYGVQVFEKSN